MWGVIFETLFDFLPWKLQLALFGSFILIVAVAIFWATRA